MAIHKLIIPKLLPGANEYIEANRTNKHAGGKMKRDIEGDLIKIIKNQLKGVRFEAPVVMIYLWVEKNKRRDKDNIAFSRKFIQDALIKAGVLRNDGWREIEGFKDDFVVDSVNPRVEVTIIEISVNTNKNERITRRNS